jgi:Resolvase, N terminal domain
MTKRRLDIRQRRAAIWRATRVVIGHVVAEWDRATRSMFDGIHLIERINARGALIKVLDKPHLDLTTPLGRGFIAFLSAMAEDERQRIVKRANDGRKAARSKGVRLAGNPSSRTTSRPRPSSASTPARAAGRSPGQWPCITRRFRGWRGEPAPMMGTRTGAIEHPLSIAGQTSRPRQRWRMIALRFEMRAP